MCKRESSARVVSDVEDVERRVKRVEVRWEEVVSECVR